MPSSPRGTSRGQACAHCLQFLTAALHGSPDLISVGRPLPHQQLYSRKPILQRINLFGLSGICCSMKQAESYEFQTAGYVSMRITHPFATKSHNLGLEESDFV